MSGKWIAWNGGECPVAGEVLVEAETFDGARYEGRADQFKRGRWEHSTYLQSSGDWIRAFRVISS